MGEVEGDDVAVEGAAGELEGAFVDGTQGEDVVFFGEGGEAGVLVGFGEDEGYAAEDGEFGGGVFGGEGVWDRAFLGVVSIDKVLRDVV